uniref:Uncharacterized protein n=1 Tax=Ananas comosus var. bracteatus TaxID=296719 RepID=A0A6V7NXJ3_ANACO|nr:unnamed protein product [Ananas comosus var. bracteatus]
MRGLRLKRGEPLSFLSHSPAREFLLSVSRTLPHSSLPHSLRPESDAAVAAAVAGADCTRARAPVSPELLLSVSRTLPHSSLSHSLRPESEAAVAADAAVAAAVAGADYTASAVPSLLSIATTLFH